MAKKIFILISLLILVAGCRELGSERLAKFQDSPFSTIVLTDAEFDKKSGQLPYKLDWHNTGYLTICGTSLHRPTYVLNIQQLTVTRVVRKDDSANPFCYSKISPDGKYIAYAIEDDGIEISKLDELFTLGNVFPDHHIDIELQSAMEWSRDSQNLAVAQLSKGNGVFLQIYNLPDQSLKKIFEYSEGIGNTEIYCL